jgi:hypothetical protein
MKNKYLEYFLYFLLVVIFIAIANITVNYFVSLSTLPFIKIVGDSNTWILFNSSVIGSIIGGFVAGIIAFHISKAQIEKENKNNLLYRKLELKYSVQVDVSRKVLDILDVLLTQHYLEAKFIKNISEQIEEYRKYSMNKDSIKNEDNIASQIKDYCRKNYDMLFQETIKDFDYQFKLNHIYSSYTIIIFDYKSSFENILNKLTSLKNIKAGLNEIFGTIIQTIEDEKNIKDIDYSTMLNLINGFRKKVNLLIYELNCFNVDIQNTLEFLFNDKIEKPEYREQI